MATSSTLKTEEEIVPYQFEPRREQRNENTASDSDDWVTDSGSDEDDEKLEGRNVVDAEKWCTCSHCQTKYSVSECICCWEIDETRKIMENDHLKCIIEHDGFPAVCLSKDVLWTALVNLADREDCYLPSKENVENRTYRYAAYRQFTWWVHNRLGRHVRRVIPSCAVSRIRAEFEEDDACYTVFKGDDTIASEITKAMEWVGISQNSKKL